MRWAALNVTVKAFKTSIPVSFLAPILGFTPPSLALKSAGPEATQSKAEEQPTAQPALTAVGGSGAPPRAARGPLVFSIPRGSSAGTGKHQ